MSVLTIIPARSGSKRLPGKNWMTVGGMRLVDRAITCSCWQLFSGTQDRAVIVTDAPERFAKGEDVLAEPPELATETTKLGDVVRWVIERTDWIGLVVVLQPTSPFRVIADVQRCVKIQHRSDCDSVVSVTYDLQTKGYKRNGAVYLTRAELAARGELMGGWSQFYVMPPERSIDINTAEDLAEARRLAGDTV